MALMSRRCAMKAKPNFRIKWLDFLNKKERNKNLIEFKTEYLTYKKWDLWDFTGNGIWFCIQNQRFDNQEHRSQNPC